MNLTFDDGSKELEIEYIKDKRLYFSIIDFVPWDVEGSYCSIDLPVTQELVDRLRNLLTQLEIDLL